MTLSTSATVLNQLWTNRMCFFKDNAITKDFQDEYWKLETKNTSFTLLKDTSQWIQPAFHRKAEFYYVWSVKALMCSVISTTLISVSPTQVHFATNGVDSLKHPCSLLTNPRHFALLNYLSTFPLKAFNKIILAFCFKKKSIFFLLSKDFYSYYGFQSFN